MAVKKGKGGKGGMWWSQGLRGKHKFQGEGKVVVGEGEVIGGEEYTSGKTREKGMGKKNNLIRGTLREREREREGIESTEQTLKRERQREYEGESRR